ncbi:glycosyl hydrolase 115 family protein [Mucilaginibacter terrae]|uniref:Glycosyl hydrolase n=1 Tax=Mucilaginibacter terrae TaxID=1955052 RepID=A0ABU3GR19_9SPHI|nr:glycosyl hydrolase 115 family protein [Mucilaginibacter terrae]MDT3402227.1 hypothetical protein [Mucilaginibacter terrae]
MKKILNCLAALIITLIAASHSNAQNSNTYISAKKVPGTFPLAAAGRVAPLWVSNADYPGVIRAVKDLQTDVKAVTQSSPQLLSNASGSKQVVIIGTIGKSPVIDQLIKNKKLNVSGIAGKWETFLLQTVQHPMPGVEQALVIAGSDKRGTIYGIYDLSAQIGVSPWYWWADVPAKQQKNLHVLPGRHTMGEPAVKYRGIFINDEAPAFSGWTKEKFGGFNSKMYAKMFELILRLKGNYLWPAMWGNAFNTDDPANRATADEYGIVMGTSHHEPMDRAQQEWKQFGKGDWNYNTNGEVLRDFWRKGIEGMGNAETLVTIGMRGDGDMAMEQGTNISLLEKIVADQRKIIADVTQKPAEQTPQVWALYKEVQDYYDKGMRVPDDVTLLLCDDNWGNIRKLPQPGEKPRKGGFGIYYHFDYVGGPRNYKWLNTNPIAKVWEQMHLAYEHNARQLWIVNVGDLKPMEFPISFFLDYAWNPEKLPANCLQEYTRQWAAQQFGEKHSVEIASMLSLYTKYNGRRKPELLNTDTYSLTNYREFERVVTDYNNLKKQAEKLNEQIPQTYRDAYYQLVLHPIQACANLNEMYYETNLNLWYANQGRAAANDKAAKVKALFARDAEISKYYNTQLANGKWNHMMDQTHISYTYWQQPPVNKIPDVKEIKVPEKAFMCLSVEGSGNWWPLSATHPALPAFSKYGPKSYYIEIFNRGAQPFTFKATPSVPWLKITPAQGTVDMQQRIEVSVDWAKAPASAWNETIRLKGSEGGDITVKAQSDKAFAQVPTQGFVQSNGYIAIDAHHYSKAISSSTIKWLSLPDHGRTSSAVTPTPVTAPLQTPGGNSPYLEYMVNLADTGLIELNAYLSPTIDFSGSKKLQYAVSIDDEKPQIFHLNADSSPRVWNKAVSENIIIQKSKHNIQKPGVHTVKFWMVSPAVVLQRMILNINNGLQPSYLGPPESQNL